MRLALVMIIGATTGSGGCWRDSAPAVAEPVSAPGPSAPMAMSRTACSDIGAHVATLARAAADQPIAANADQVGRVVENRCAQDAWSVELKDCLTSADTLDVAERCEQFATDDQRHALDDDIEHIAPVD